MSFKYIFAARTTKPIRIIVILSFVVVLLAGLFALKLRYFPYSLSYWEYVTRVAEILATWTGAILILASIIVYVALPLLMNRPVGEISVEHAARDGLNTIGKALDRSVISYLTLIICIAAVIYSVFVSFRASLPPPPPAAGRLMLPTDQRSAKMCRILQNQIVVEERNSGRASAEPRSLVFKGSLDRMAGTNDLARLFVTNSEQGLIHVIDTSRLTEERTPLAVEETAGPLTLTGDGAKLYVGIIGNVAHGVVGRIHVFDSKTLGETATITGVGCPVDLFAASRAHFLFVATQCGNGEDPLYVIDTSRDEIVAKLRGFATGNAVVSTPDGRKVFVSTGDSLSIVEFDGKKLCLRYRKQINVSGMTLTPDTSLLLVGTQVDDQPVLASFDVKNEKWCKTVALEEVPSSIAVSPGQNPMLFAQLPKRTYVGDVHSLACD